MADMWERIRKELASPWDWVAAGIGAAGGLGVTATVGGMDAGTSAGIGALAAVSARKAGVASLRGGRLKRKARGLLGVLEAYQRNPEASNSNGARQIVSKVQRDLHLWKEGVINHDQFDALLNQPTYRELQKFTVAGV